MTFIARHGGTASVQYDLVPIPSPPVPMVDVEAGVDALPATERRDPKLAREKQKRRETCRSEMLLDWVQSPGQALEVTAVASASRVQKSTTLCAGCAKWRRTSHFQGRASTCNPCARITCTGCGRSKKPRQYRRQDIGNYMKQRGNTRCRACRRREYFRRCRCTECGVYQHVSAFRWTKRRGREDICRSCEMVPCAACPAMLSSGNCEDSHVCSYFNSVGAKHMTCLVCKVCRCTKCGACTAMLSNGSFADSDIYSYLNSAGAKHIVCLVCNEQRQHAGQQQLHKRTKKRKRKFCTCKHPQAHTRTCVLRLTFA